MAKNLKLIVYGEPGVGKSTFAAGAPNPFFITTDGNYEYLEDFCGLKPENHIQCYSWAEMKKAFTRDFSNYDTIVVDLLEDSYLWAENEFCKDNHLMHISDLGYGKGYGILGNDFFIEYQKLLALPKNVILLMHGVTEVLKDRRGVEYSKYGPSKLVREKILTQLEGRVRFFVRAYAQATEAPDGRLVTKRYLSLSPDGNTEYGITRGLNADVPHSIPLNWDTFISTIDEYSLTLGQTKTTEIKPNIKSEIKKEEIVEEPKIEVKVEKKPRKTKQVVEEDTTTTIDNIREKLQAVLNKPMPAIETIDATSVPQEELVEKIKDAYSQPALLEPMSITDETPKVLTQAEKLAAIKAKMAALKNNK